MKAKHTLIVIICCLVPIAAIVAVSIFKVPLNNVLVAGMVLLCPLSHLLMMKYMMGDHGDEQAAHLHVAKEKIHE